MNYKHVYSITCVSRNSMGQRLVLTSFGESHGSTIGAVLDGCPAGLELAEEDIQPMLDWRRPGQSVVTTQRMEDDRAEIISGTYRGRTTGAPITIIIKNSDQRSVDYDDMQSRPRPGHSDYTAMIKYGRFNDYRGGGRFSGRLTATHVMGGAVARKLLKESLDVETCSYVQQIGCVEMDGQAGGAAARDGPGSCYDQSLIYGNESRCPDPGAAESMRKSILDAKRSGDSLGGVIRSVTTGIPAGLGEPIFGSLESDLGAAMFSIPSVKGVEFGSGFAGSSIRGSENNDAFYVTEDESGAKRVATRTNNSGGILGGISNGMPITMRVAFKPASSIPREQSTVNVDTMSKDTLRVGGRHDPCVVPRAPPVVDSLVSLVVADHALVSGHIKPVLEK
ncbi:MAG: chorismate synthase [Nitrosopumilaceae archaeon]|nr:chorismate synthase [Nitrosopumilaceae archaeon]